MREWISSVGKRPSLCLCTTGYMSNNDLLLVVVGILISFSRKSGWISISSSAFVSAWVLRASLASSSNCFQASDLNEPKIPHKNDLFGSWLLSRSGKYSSRSDHCLTNSQTNFTPNSLYLGMGIMDTSLCIRVWKSSSEWGLQ